MTTIRDTLAPQVRHSARAFFAFPTLCIVVILLYDYPALQIGGLALMIAVSVYTWRLRENLRCPRCGGKLGELFHPPSKGPQVLREMKACPHCHVSLDEEAEADASPL